MKRYSNTLKKQLRYLFPASLRPMIQDRNTYLRGVQENLSDRNQKKIRSRALRVYPVVSCLVAGIWGCVKISGGSSQEKESLPTISGETLDTIDPQLAQATLLLKAYIPPPCNQEGEGTIVTCTAVAIGKRQVLTAAHCVAQSNTINIYRGIEAKDDFRPHIVQKVEFLRPPASVSYDLQGQDLAKLTLNKDFDLSLVKPIKLPDPRDRIVNAIMNISDAPHMTLEYVLLGRGHHQGQKNDLGQLKAAKLTLYNANYAGLQGTRELAMNRATDSGDSGSPLFTRDFQGQWVLLGILSGVKVQPDGKPPLSIFVPIPRYLSFITEK